VNALTLTTNTPAHWSAIISAHWQKTAQGFIDTGRALLQAKDSLPHGTFDDFCETCLPFTARTAQRLMRVAECRVFTEPEVMAKLPPSWDTMHTLAQLAEKEPETFRARIIDGTINPSMKRAEIANGLTESRRQDRLSEMRTLADNPMKLPRGPFAAAIADPPWENSERAIGFSDRHYRNKYPTMRPDQIAAMPVAAMFGKHAFIALWVTSHHVALGSHVGVLRAWGFTPNTVAVWDKQWIGLGNGFFRDRTEHIVCGTRGDVPAPCASLRPDSLYSERRSAVHSAKPESWLHDLIEIWFPSMSYVELFARSPREGWVTWGNQANGEAA
jgi:N6-adenosine-specific RNA methylase IME4